MQPTTVVALEEIAHDGAAGGDIIFADILRPLVGGAHGALGQKPANLVGLLIVGALDRLPNLLLALMVRTDRESHELVERHAVLGVNVE